MWLSLALVVVAASFSAAQAQNICEPSETVQACVNRLAKDLPSDGARTTEVAAANAANTTEQGRVAKKTETSLSEVAGLSSSIKDFVPLLQMSGVLGGVQKNDQTGLVTVALNTPFLGSTGVAKKDNALQLKAVIDTTASLFEPLRNLLPEKDRDAVAKQLVGAKPDAQNVTLHASYNISSRRLGRNFQQHQDTLQALFQSAMSSLATVQETFMERVAGLADTVPGKSLRMEWSKFSIAEQTELQRQIVALRAADTTLQAGIAAAVRERGLDAYGQLVNNQPQLTLSASRTVRDDLFGPDLLTGRVSFEMGLDNSLNAALGPYNSTCSVRATECLKTYSDFVKAARAAIKDGSRLSMFIEFVHNDAYHFTKADPALDLTIAEGTGWTAGVEYGRLIAVDEGGTAGARVDGSLKWEAPADKAIDRRLVASLTLTKKLGELSVPFGIVYANKPKFLTGVDHGLTANIGLKFNLFNGLN